MADKPKTMSESFQKLMDALDEVDETDIVKGPLPLTPSQMEAYKRAWNNRIAMHYGGDEEMQARMHHRRARRMLRRRR